MHKFALAFVVATWTVAACGTTDDAVDGVDAVDAVDAVDEKPAEADDAGSLTVDSIEVSVSECTCRCTTPTNTALTVHGTGFFDGVVVTVDGAEPSYWVEDARTIQVTMWTSPPPGEHTVVVDGGTADGTDAIARGSFVMPEAAQNAE